MVLLFSLEKNTFTKINCIYIETAVKFSRRAVTAYRRRHRFDYRTQTNTTLPSSGYIELVGNTDMLDGGDSIWLGNSIWCWYIIWLRDMLGDLRGDVFGLE